MTMKVTKQVLFFSAILIIIGITFYFIGKQDGEVYITPKTTFKSDSLRVLLDTKQLSYDSILNTLHKKDSSLEALKTINQNITFKLKGYEKLSTDSVDLLFIERFNSAIRQRKESGSFKYIRPARVSYEKGD